MHKITTMDIEGLDLGDPRRNQRLLTIINNITDQPGSSIPKQSKSWYDTKAAYSFFQNESITAKKLQETLKNFGVSQLPDIKQVLCIHDMSNISFNNLDAEGLGYLDHKEGRGIMCYSTIAVSTEGLPLAMMYQQTWIRSLEELGKASKRKERAFEDKESHEWFTGAREVNKVIGGDVQKIHICDRGADVFELFFHGYESGTDLLIRACHDRKLSDGSHLWSSIAASKVQGVIDLEILDKTGKKQAIQTEVRYNLVEILRPARSKDQYESVELTAIEIRQLGQVNNEENRLCWRLLTSLSVSTLDDVLKYIRWYTYRWLIERFHYILKSGTKIEALQLKKASSLQKAVTVYSLAAFRIMQLVYQSRQYPDVSCETILTKQQWVTLYMLIHKNNNIPKQPPSLSQAVKWIGRLGGHLGRKSDGPPGLKTVWLGYQTLYNATSIYEILTDELLGKA